MSRRSKIKNIKAREILDCGDLGLDKVFGYVKMRILNSPCAVFGPCRVF